MSICCRTTRISYVFANTVSSASVIQFGDGATVDLDSRALAIQRAIVTSTDEAHFQEYELFYLPTLTLIPNAKVAFQSDCSGCDIQVGAVRTTGVSASSFLRAGCGGPLKGDSRIVHVRQFNDPGHPLIS